MPIKIDPKQFPTRERRKRSAWSQMDWSSWRRFSSSIFINKGTMVTKELSFKGQLRPIPPGECAITSLTMADNYYIYGATSGEKVHIFRYRPRGENGVVADMGDLPGETECRNSLVITKSGEVVLGTRSNQARYRGGKLYKTRAMAYHGSFIQEWGLRGSEIEEKLCPFKGEGMARMVYDTENDLIFGLTDRSGTLFIYDPESNKIKKIGQTDERGYSWSLVQDNKGILYGAGFEGHIWRLDPKVGKVEFTGAFMPTFAGREVFDIVDSLVYDRVSGLIYGGSREHGTLFSFDPETATTKLLGKPTINPRLKALTVGNDGRVYGITGDRDDLAHMFVYDPEEASIQDMGLPVATMENRWYGYVFDCLITGDDGELYLGQSERTSQLFIYFPDIKAR